MQTSPIENDVPSKSPRDDKNDQSPYASANLSSVVVYYLSTRIFSGAAGIIFAVLLVRHMDVVEYSRYATMLGISSTVGILSSLGIEKAVTCFVPEGRVQHRGKALSRFVWQLVRVRTAALFIMTAILTTCWSYLSDDPTLPGSLYVLIALLIIGTNTFQFLSLILQALIQQKILTNVMVVQWGGRLMCLTLILSLYAHVGLEWALYVAAVPEIIGSIILLVVLRRYLRAFREVHAENTDSADRWPAWPNVGKVIRHNYGYSWLITAPQGNSMIVIGALFFTSLQLGAYGFFVSLIDRIRGYLPLNLMLNLAEPVLIAGYVEDRNFQNLCRRADILYKPNFVFLMLLLAWTCAVSPLITGLLTGGKYVEYSVLLPLLIAQATLGSRNTILQVIVNAVGRSEVLSKSGAIALASMGLFFVFYLVAGAAKLLLLTTPLIFETVNFILTVFLLRRAGFLYDWHGAFHIKVFLAAIIAFAVARVLQAHMMGAVYQLIAAGLASAVVFGAVCRILRVVDMDDWIAVQRLLRARVSEKK